MSDPTPAPDLTARVKALETFTMAIYDKVIETGNDMHASFRQISDEMLQEARKGEARHAEMLSQIAGLCEEMAAMEARTSAEGQARDARLLDVLVNLTKMLEKK